MSSDLRRNPSARTTDSKDQFQSGTYVSVEDNLGKLGFLAQPRKKKSRSDKREPSGQSGPSDSHSKIHHLCFMEHGCVFRSNVSHLDARHVDFVSIRLSI
jgi:hypothetical protein